MTYIILLCLQYYHEEAPFTACMAQISDNSRPFIGSSVYQQIEVYGWDIFCWNRMRMLESLLRMRGVVVGRNGSVRLPDTAIPLVPPLSQGEIFREVVPWVWRLRRNWIRLKVLCSITCWEREREKFLSIWERLRFRCNILFGYWKFAKASTFLLLAV